MRCSRQRVIRSAARYSPLEVMLVRARVVARRAKSVSEPVGSSTVLILGAFGEIFDVFERPGRHFRAEIGPIKVIDLCMKVGTFTFNVPSLLPLYSERIVSEA
jgi:hypothetical protein